MADYDAEVRVSTKVDTSQMQRLQLQIDKAVQNVDALTKKYDELKNKKIPTDDYQKLETQLATAKSELAELIKQEEEFTSIGVTSGGAWDNLVQKEADAQLKIESINEEMQKLVDAGKDFTVGASSDELNKVANELSNAKSELKMLVTKQDELENKTEKTSGKFKGLVSRFKNLLLGVLVFNQIRRAFNSMITSMKDGFKNLAQYSQNYNAQMSALKSSTAQLKNGLATAFEPIVTMALPYLTKLVSVLNTACNAIARFMAAISGKNTYTKAKKQVVDYAKSLGTATDATQGALAAFDEINVLETGGGGSGSGEATGANAFEEAQIDPEFLLTLEKVREILEIISPLVVTIGTALLTWSLINFLSGLMQAHPLLGKIVSVLMIIVGLVLAVYNYINMWKNGVDWGGLIGYITGVSLVVAGLFVLIGPMAAGIALLIAGAAGIILALKDIHENGLNAQNMTLLLVSAVGLLVGIFLVFGAPAAAVVAGITAIIGVFALLIKWTGNGQKMLGYLKGALNSLGKFMKDVFAGDWEAAWQDVKDFTKNIINALLTLIESMVNGMIKGVNMLIDTLNKVSFAIPDWVPEIGGKSFGLNIPHIDWQLDIPKLANGAVIRGGSPFLAMLGDQPAGQTNIETPLDTMVEAFRQALDEYSGVPLTPVIRFDGSLSELGRVLRPVIEMENDRIGNSFGR